MSTQDPGGDFYPRVESIRDSFGFSTNAAGEAAASHHVETGVTLQLGDRVVFQCRASDPQGRSVRWWIATSGRPREAAAEGDDAEFTWVVNEQEVGERIGVAVYMAADSKFHRHADGHDGYATFIYRVDPPSRP